MPDGTGPPVCECGSVMTPVPVVLQECAVRVDKHRDALVALIPRDAAATLWQVATATHSVAWEDPEGLLTALERVPASVVEEIRAALVGHVPRVHVPSLAWFVRRDPTPGTTTDRPRPAGSDAVVAVLTSVRYVLDADPRRAQKLLEIVQGLTGPLIRESQKLLDDTKVVDQCTRYLALGVTLASGVLFDLKGEGFDLEDAAIGLGLGMASVLSRILAQLATNIWPASEVPEPDAGGRPARPALVSSSASAGRIVFADHEVRPSTVPESSFAPNGLVAVIEGGLVIRTGDPTAQVLVRLSVVASEPLPIDTKWQEIVDVSFTTNGPAVLADQRATFELPDPGDYRARVQARRRDVGVEEGSNSDEQYALVIWPAPLAPERVLAAADRLGHRLRGEPEPPALERPEVAFRPVVDLFQHGVTVTVSVGATLDEVLHAFGANSVLESSRDPYDGLIRPVVIPSRTWDRPGIAVLEITDYRGTKPSVLEELSMHGRAASMYCNVNFVTQLSLAENGELLESVEYWDLATHPVTLALFHGLDVHTFQDVLARGLVVIERFTGCAVTEESAAQVQAMTVGYRLSS